MPFSLPILAVSVIAVITVLNLLGWPRLRLRTYNRAHGGLRIIELALILSRTAARSQGWWDGVRHFARKSHAVVRSTYGSAAPAGSITAGAAKAPELMEYVQPGAPTADELATAPTVAPSAVSPAEIASSIKGAAAVRTAWAECVVYVTLKVGHP